MTDDQVTSPANNPQVKFPTYDPTGRSASHSVGQPPLPSEFLGGGFWRRLAAAFIDGMIIFALNIPVSIYTQFLKSRETQSPEEAFFISFVTITLFFFTMVLGYIYVAWFNNNRGGTIGKLTMGLRVRDTRTLANLSWGQTFYRQYIALFISALAVFHLITAFMIVFRKDKRGLHDLMAHTQVVRSV